MTNEQAIKIISETPVTYANPDEQGVWDEALRLAIAALERDRWISASTPPDTNRFVLVMNDEGRCGVAQYVGDDFASITPWQIAYCLYDVDTWDDEEQGPVCWWRELPEPPKEET